MRSINESRKSFDDMSRSAAQISVFLTFCRMSTCEIREMAWVDMKSEIEQPAIHLRSEPALPPGAAHGAILLC